jgi:hypothetical protein
MAITGHVSPRMLAHSSHVRLGAKRSALDADHHANTRRTPFPVRSRR